MRGLRRVCRLASAIPLILPLCWTSALSPAAAPAAGVPGDLPPETAFNSDAGRGEELVIKLRWDGWGEVPVVLDTGASHTVFHLSVTNRLGKPRGTKKQPFGFASLSSAPASLYDAPTLYLGGVPLRTASSVRAADLTNLFLPKGVLGILGMDCLRFYCFQLDFELSRIRFLPPRQPKTANLGQPFTLAGVEKGELSSRMDLFGGGRRSFVIDTGLWNGDDAILAPACFKSKLREEKPVFSIQQYFGGTMILGGVMGYARKSMAGESYTNVILREHPAGARQAGLNFIGLSFLARHQVTFDMPGGTMFLRKVRGDPADPGPFFEYMETQKFDHFIQQARRLPGVTNYWEGYAPRYVWSAAAKPYTELAHPIINGLVLSKPGAQDEYHFCFEPNAGQPRKKLVKAWRTDREGHLLEEYAVPETGAK